MSGLHYMADDLGFPRDVQSTTATPTGPGWVEAYADAGTADAEELAGKHAAFNDFLEGRDDVAGS